MNVSWQLRAGVAAVVALATLLALRPGWVTDPFIRNDDYLTYFPAPDLLYLNTLTEGRWLNQLWAWRGWAVPAPAAYVAACALWCGAAGMLAARVVPGWVAIAVAVALATAPQVAQLMFWFNLQVPAMAILAAAVGAMAAWGPRRWTVGLAAVLAMLSYPPNAFIVLLAALALCKGPDMRERWALCAATVGGLVVGYVMIAGINGMVHGIWGVLPAPWRDPTPARDLDGLLGNLGVLGVGVPALGGALLVLGALGLLMALRLGLPDRVRGLLAGGAVAVLVLSAVTLFSGTPLPNRATGFVWVLVVLLCAGPWSRGRAGALVALAIVGGASWHIQLDSAYQRYQEATRVLAGRVLAVDPAPRLIVLTGPLDVLHVTHVLAEPIALAFRVEQLTGVETIYCPPSGRPVRREALHPAAEPRIALENRHREICTRHGEGDSPQDGTVVVPLDPDKKRGAGGEKSRRPKSEGAAN